MTAFDQYEAVKNFIGDLDADRHFNEAASLRTAMESGSTGTEILMALRFSLNAIVKQTPLKRESQMKASRLLAELNNKLS